MENFGASDASLQRLPRARPKLALFPWHVRSTRSFQRFPFPYPDVVFKQEKTNAPRVGKERSLKIGGFALAAPVGLNRDLPKEETQGTARGR